ncbi:hypothetical protein HYH03_017478 [Edaphochlamys debaryana]|uniref:Cation-transporting P-type ATPase C-terminal domain-containing protein n=1 Tax=Edaphochlamys debaryana TaxID=47281 RepID=A0A835XHV9_9CHLO|nr:hypothetical protein HYH03_017478 [Edaphochlamys debaryana]|eukprot:KAG2483675.1 hypothetical protein HYH03_017478 [Edaphochlamys debaryana]
MLSPTATVLRGGTQEVIQAEDLVPGDILLLRAGDLVPADVRLVEATNLQIQEAMLTGESVPTSKALAACAPAAPLGDRRCIAFAATHVAAGTGRGVVVAVGDGAEIGRINKMVASVGQVRNNLLHQLEVLGRWLVSLVLIIGLVAFLLALLRTKTGFQTAFESAVSIAVAIVPEGLPAVVTIVLAIGTTVMARNNAIVRQMAAVETLGSLNVICSDKTGTLTKNEMTAVRVVTAAGVYGVSGVGYEPVGHLHTAALTPEDAPPEPTKPAPPAPADPAQPHTAIAIGPDPNAPEGDSPKPITATPTPALPASSLSALRSLLEGAVLCNDSALSATPDPASGRTLYKPMGAPTEAALLTLGAKMGLGTTQELTEAKPRLAAVPFESEFKFMATAHDEGGGRRVLWVKGAPDRLLPMCSQQVLGDDLSSLGSLDGPYWAGAQAALGSQGLRVLALCRAELPPGFDLSVLSAKWLQQQASPGPPPPALRLSCVALVALLDPPREEAVRAVHVAHAAGITVKMITGDHALTALAIGKMLGLAGNGRVITGPELDATNDEALRHLVSDCNVFARTSPENKLRIVQALQANRQVVAMTGDGVNDAPALKAADVGVAMGITGTDVAKEAAKMVLADDNFATIVAAVREGRRVWDNIRKILIFNLPVNLAQGTSILYAYILGFQDPPLTALQVLLVNLITSVTLGLALAAEPPEPGVMQRPPRRAGKRLVGKLLLWRMFFVCHIIDILVIGMFHWAGNTGLSLAKRRAESFCVLVGSQVVYFVNCRFIKLASFHPRVVRGNPWMYLSMSITLGLMVFVTYVPGVNNFFHMAGMIGVQWARVVVCLAIVFTVVEIEKALVDPLFMPILRPVFAWLEAHTPEWLSVNTVSNSRVVSGLKSISLSSCTPAACGKSSDSESREGSANGRTSSSGGAARKGGSRLARVMSQRAAAAAGGGGGAAAGGGGEGAKAGKAMATPRGPTAKSSLASTSSATDANV